MNSINFSEQNVSPPFTLSILFALLFLSLIPISTQAQEILYEGINLRLANFDYEKVTVYDPDNFNEVLIVMLKDKSGADIGTVTLSRMNFGEKTSLPTDQRSKSTVMQNEKKDVMTMDKGIGQWTFKNNVKIDQHKAQHYELDSKIAREGQLFLIETTKEQILIKLIYKKGIDENLVKDFKDWITEVKVLLNQSPRNN